MKNITILTALVLTIGSAAAQEGPNATDNREKFQFGLKAGLNYSNVYDEEGEQFNADAKYGYAAGISFDLPLGKYLGLQPGALITQKGFQGSGAMLGSPYSFTRTTTYLDIPLLASFKPSEFFSLLAGVEYSYLLMQEDVFTNTLTSYSQEEEFKNENIRKNIFGFVAGLDINLKHISLGARACWDFQNNNGDGTASTPNYKNVWFQGTLGYKFYN